MTKTEKFSLEQEENTMGIITEWVSLCVCVWVGLCAMKREWGTSFVYPYSLLICRLQFVRACVCVGGRECVTSHKLCLRPFV